jgi:hypothetical protein
MTAVLQTWGQTLTEHRHLHCVVTGGGLSAEGTRWRAGRRRLLFAVKALSQVFGGKYLAGLSRLRSQHRLTFAGQSAEWVTEAAWAKCLHQLPARPWGVYATPPWGGPEQVLKYLSRSTHRVAIANQRLGFVGEGSVRFRYKDYAAGGTTKVRELRAEEFLRRFLLPVVPSGFVRSRHLGWLANRTRQAKLTRCRQLLAGAAAAATSLLPASPSETPTASPAPAAAARCPGCGGGRRRVTARLAPRRGIPP